MQKRGVVLFTKPAVPGRVKTRLIGRLSAVQAAQVHGALLDDLLERLEGGPFDLHIAWALVDGEVVPKPGVPGFRQQGGDLSDRLLHGLRSAGRYEYLAAIGSDHPELHRDDLDRAFGVLEQGGADVVIGPALDGGYYLIGFARAALSADLFAEIPWSTSAVLEATKDRCREAGLRVSSLQSAADVDTAEDLDRLAGKVRGGLEVGRRTEALLRTLGYLHQGGRSCES